jgi:branched chain amino acid efflux pump
LSKRISNKKKDFMTGVSTAWPICLGYIPIGLAFGVIAEKSGLNPLEIGLMSLLVFAGSAQFIAVSMLSGGATSASIIATTFMVNLRHFLMSSSLAVYLKPDKGRRKWLWILAYGVTDESFAINLAKFRQGNWDMFKTITVNQTANFVWFISTVSGGFGGQFIPKGAFGIDYALIAMFICLLIFQIHGAIYVVTAIISGLSAIGFALLLPGNSYIILASILAATLGLFVKKWINHKTVNEPGDQRL